jgi:hypothetical protein
MRFIPILIPLLLLAACSGAGRHHESVLHLLEATGQPPRDPSFQVAPRTDHMTRFPCSRCHKDSFAATRPVPNPAGEKKAAHWEIRLEHAGKEVMQCATCHSESQMDSLHTLNKQPVPYNESHKLCAQCHSRQEADWRGGAHGKRAAGWAAERTINNCTSCHDPHRPRLEPRWPSVARKYSEERAR